MRRNIIRKKKFQEWEEGLIKYSTSHNQRTEGRMALSTRFGKVEGVGWEGVGVKYVFTNRWLIQTGKVTFRGALHQTIEKPYTKLSSCFSFTLFSSSLINTFYIN